LGRPVSHRIAFYPKRADTAYWGTELWLPKDSVPQHAIRNSLTFETSDGVTQVEAFWETDDHIVVPRETFTPEKLAEFGFPVVDIQKKVYEHVDFEDVLVPRDEQQQKAWDALSRARGGVLNLGCGMGKSGLALKKAAQLGGPVLIVVNNIGTLKQWIEEVEKFLPNIRRDDIGLVKGPKFDWRHPITMATIQTLSSRSDTWPAEFLNYWKLVIMDEAHHTSAKTFSKILPMFPGMRLGLTATLEREDGLESIYFYHLGQPFYSDLEQEMPVTVYFQKTPYMVSMNDERIQDVNGDFNIGRFYSYVSTVKKRNEFIAEHIQRALAGGRKILCITHSRPGVEAIVDLVEGAGAIHGGVKHDSRIDILRSHQVVIATAGCAEEALNAPALDTIMFLTPYKVWRTFQQGVGRAQRRAEGKKNPVVVLFDDYLMRPADGLMVKLRRKLRANGYIFSSVDPR
jgi:superfamily II DNA or RNA helicase